MRDPIEAALEHTYEDDDDELVVDEPHRFIPTDFDAEAELVARRFPR